MTGGDDADRFVFKRVRDSREGKPDIVSDFNQADGDRIVLDKIDADLTLAGDQSFQLGGGAFSGIAGEIIQFIDAEGDTVLRFDQDGDSQSDMVIILQGALTLTGADFVV